MELISPDGGTRMLPHPGKVDYYLSKGWTIVGEEKPAKVEEEVVEEIQEPEEVEETDEAEEEEES